ncbi:MAG: hypothetical protein ACOYN0_01680 [Phycisphaerales bacterium]
MKQAVLAVALVVILGIAAFVAYSKMNPGSSADLVVRNVSDEVLTVQVGTKAPAVLAKDATARDSFVEGMLVRVWVGGEGKGVPIGWRIFKINGELSVSYANDEVKIEADGLDQVLLNNGPGPADAANAPAQPAEAPK